MGSNPVAVSETSDIAPVSSNEVLNIQATIEWRFTLKHIRDMIITYSQFKACICYSIKSNFFIHQDNSFHNNIVNISSSQECTQIPVAVYYWRLSWLPWFHRISRSQASDFLISVSYSASNKNYFLQTSRSTRCYCNYVSPK